MRALRGETVEGEEVLLWPPDRPALRFRVTGRRVHGLDGELRGAVVELHDVTAAHDAALMRAGAAAFAMETAGTEIDDDSLQRGLSVLGGELGWSRVGYWVTGGAGHLDLMTQLAAGSERPGLEPRPRARGAGGQRALVAGALPRRRPRRNGRCAAGHLPGHQRRPHDRGAGVRRRGVRRAGARAGQPAAHGLGADRPPRGAPAGRGAGRDPRRGAGHLRPGAAAGRRPRVEHRAARGRVGALQLRQPQRLQRVRREPARGDRPGRAHHGPHPPRRRPPVPGVPPPRPGGPGRRRRGPHRRVRRRGALDLGPRGAAPRGRPALRRRHLQRRHRAPRAPGRAGAAAAAGPAADRAPARPAARARPDEGRVPGHDEPRAAQPRLGHPGVRRPRAREPRTCRRRCAR